MKDQVEKLVKKAVESDDANSALKLTQAALNAAHAMQVLGQVERSEKD